MTLDGDPYIRREGYAVIASRLGLRVRVELLERAGETDHTSAEALATVWPEGEDPDEGWVDVGSAHVDVEDMKDARGNLDELAATRAITRALSWATGAGISAAEVQEGSA